MSKIGETRHINESGHLAFEARCELVNDPAVCQPAQVWDTLGDACRHARQEARRLAKDRHDKARWEVCAVLAKGQSVRAYQGAVWEGVALPRGV